MNRELWILSNDMQSTLDTLSLDSVTVEETREIGKPRQIKVTHPIREFPDDKITRYLEVIRQGNKLWWPETPDGDPCLYVINSSITIDPILNQIVFTAEDVSVELSYLPPLEFPTYFSDKFTHGRSSAWVDVKTGGSVSITSKGKMRLASNTSGAYYTYVPVTGAFTASVWTKPVQFSTNGVASGILIHGTQGYLYGYQIIRRKNESGAHKMDVWRADNGVWTSLASINDDLYATKLLRTTYDGTTISFEYSSNNGKNYSDIYSETSPYTPAGVGLKAWNGMVCDFDDFTVFTPDGFQKTVNPSFLGNVTQGLFTYDASGGVSSTTVFLGGYLSPMNILREIEAQTGYEFDFWYDYDPASTPPLKRYFQLKERIGTTYDVVLDPLEDFSEFRIVEDEGEYYSQAVPIYKESNDPMKIQNVLDAIHKYKNLGISIGTSLPSYVNEIDDGRPIMGPTKPAPYSKTSGSIVVLGTDTIADYRTVYKPDGSSLGGKTLYVENTEANEYNMYWKTAEALQEKNTPTIHVEGKVNAASLQDLEVNLKVGDIVKVKLPWGADLVELRVEKTVKSTDDLSSFTAELGNRNITAVNKWLSRFKPTGAPGKLR